MTARHQQEKTIITFFFLQCAQTKKWKIYIHKWHGMLSGHIEVKLFFKSHILYFMQLSDISLSAFECQIKYSKS